MKFLAPLILAALLPAVAAQAETLEKIPSPDGKLVALIERGEGDWRFIDVVDSATGKKRSDHLEWASFTTVAWLPDGSGFYYSRQPKPWDDPALQIFNAAHSVEFHRVGTDQSADEDVYATDRANMYHTAQVTKDGRWLVITSSDNHEPRHEIILNNLKEPLPAPFKLIRGLDAAWWLAGSRGDVLYFVTTKDAPRGRLVFIDVNATAFKAVTIVPEGADTLKSAEVMPNNTIRLTFAGSTKIIPAPEAAQ
jgi:prolyl oligopeptidase